MNDRHLAEILADPTSTLDLLDALGLWTDDGQPEPFETDDRPEPFEDTVEDWRDGAPDLFDDIRAMGGE